VGELTGAVQVKLLRVLDSQIIERVGSVKPIGLDVRILAATNRNLTEDVRTGRFRSDLYYRLAVMQVELPPLADRREDIVPLAEHFLAILAGTGKAPAVLNPSAAQTLQRHTWPGNVRELKNAVEHAAAVAPGERISPEDLPAPVREAPMGAAEGDVIEQIAMDLIAALPHTDGLHRGAIEPIERAVICEALRRSGGNQSEASDLLGLHRNTLRKKLLELDIDPETAS
jgi:DNA-binding NtrC family response regulator